jgi:hypothetical protein
LCENEHKIKIEYDTVGVRTYKLMDKIKTRPAKSRETVPLNSQEYKICFTRYASTDSMTNEFVIQQFGRMEKDN